MNDTDPSLTQDIPTASELILDILGMLDGVTFTPAQAVHAGSAFGYSSATMRAALSRLKEREKLRNVGRGIYGLPEKPMVEWSFNRSWRDYVEEIIQWSGHWMLLAGQTTPNFPVANRFPEKTCCTGTDFANGDLSYSSGQII